MKTVKLSELFDVERGVRLTKADQEPGNIPLVTAGEENYGINGYISNGKSKLFKNAITVDMFCHAVYRDYKFYCDDNIIVLTPKDEMELNELLYYSSCICQNKFKFGYGRQLRLSRLDEIKLPAEIPNWVYEIEDFDLSEYKESFTNDPTPELNVDDWKEFKIVDLFTLVRGKRLKSEDREPGTVPYYSASDSNNGLTDKISNPLFIESDALIYTTFGDCYYVEGEFTASDEITILKNDNVNKYSGLFLSVVLSQDKFRWSFGRKAFMERIKALTIKLPSTEDGQPDYQFMEDYIKTLPYSKHI